MPQATMASMTCYGRKMKAEPHSTHEIRGTACDGCAMMSCIPQKSRMRPWRYWCETRHRAVEPWEVECDVRQLDEPPKASFQDRLIASMESNGYTRRQVAEKMGVRLATVADWEHGRAGPWEPRASELAAMMGW